MEGHGQLTQEIPTKTQDGYHMEGTSMSLTSVSKLTDEAYSAAIFLYREGMVDAWE